MDPLAAKGIDILRDNFANFNYAGIDVTQGTDRETIQDTFKVNFACYTVEKEETKT